MKKNLVILLTSSILTILVWFISILVAELIYNRVFGLASARDGLYIWHGYTQSILISLIFVVMVFGFLILKSLNDLKNKK